MIDKLVDVLATTRPQHDESFAQFMDRIVAQFPDMTEANVAFAAHLAGERLLDENGPLVDFADQLRARGASWNTAGFSAAERAAIDDWGKLVFDKKRTDEAAAFIAAELNKLLDNGGQMDRRMHRCPAYKDGLTQGERLVAILRALSMVQLDVIAKMLTMKTERSAFDDDGNAWMIGDHIAERMTTDEMWRRLDKKDGEPKP